MKKLLKNWIFYTVLAVLVIGFGVYLCFDKTLGTKLAYIILGAFILIYTALTVFPNLKRYRNKYSKICLIVEFVFDAIVGIFMIIDTKGADLLPFVIYLRGFNILLVRYISKVAGEPVRYFIGIGLLTAGTYIWARNIIKANELYYILLGILFLFGIGLIASAVKYYKKKWVNLIFFIL